MNKKQGLFYTEKKIKKEKKHISNLKFIVCVCNVCMPAVHSVYANHDVCVCEGQRLAPSTMWILVINAHLQVGWQESYPLSHPDGPY